MEIFSPVRGCTTDSPVGMPFFSIVAMSASATPPFLHSSMNAARAGFDAAACAASGCSGATAQNVTPMMVSARVVNTYTVSYTHLRAHETRHDLVCRLLLEKKKK